MELLGLYVKYIKWARDAFPSNKDGALQLLEVYPVQFYSISLILCIAFAAMHFRSQGRH